MKPIHASDDFIKFSREDYPPDRQGAILTSSLPDFGVVVAGEYLSRSVFPAAQRKRGTHARVTLLGDDISRLSNACPKGISHFVGYVRS